MFCQKNNFIVGLLVALVIISLCSAKHVVEVTDKTFKQEVLKHDGIAIVEFYAPWCGHCKSFAPEYEAAASILKGVVKVVALDATANEKTAQAYGIQGFPTVKIFGADKKSPVDYQGQRTSDAVVTEGMRAANALVKDRKKGGGKGGSSSGSAKKEDKPRGKKSGGGKAVITLTEDDFEEKVLNSEDHWLVEFYAPWCGHCKNLAPEWEEAAKQLRSSAPNIKLGAVDATVATSLASKYGVKGYPTIKQFNAGPKKGKRAEDYRGPREAAGIVDHALASLEAIGATIPMEVNQLTTHAQFEDKCGAEANKICVIMFAPHILDSLAKGRNDYIALMKDVANKYRGKSMEFFWTEGGAQPGLEAAMDVSPNYPSVGVVQVAKGVSSVLRLSWSKKNIKSYLDGLISGSERLAKMDKAPALVTVTAWDGKDQEVVVDEISLADIMGDDE